MALDDSYWGAREDAVKVLLGKDQGVVEHLVKILNDENSSKTAQWEAIRILGQKNPGKHTALFIEALKDDDWMIRNQAAVILARLKAPKTVDPLINLLNDENRHTREEAAWILGEMKSEQTVGPLLQMLDDDDMSKLRSRMDSMVDKQKKIEGLISAMGPIVDKATNLLDKMGGPEMAGIENVMKKMGGLLGNVM